MRNLKVILLLFLVCKSTMGLSLTIDIGGNGSCCGDSLEISSSECPDSEEDTKGCCGTICDCVCCGHIFNYQHTDLTLIKDIAPLPQKKINNYNFLYLHNFSVGIWQPPRTI